MDEEEPLNDEYIGMRDRAWQGARTPIDPEHAPTQFSVGFYAGMKASVEFLVGPIVGGPVWELTRIKEQFLDE